jgi:hypothetical protein
MGRVMRERANWHLIDVVQRARELASLQRFDPEKA